METQLVTTDDAQRLAQTFGKSVESAAAELDELYQMLREMPLSKLKAEVAVEVMQKSKRYIEMIDTSEPREIATNLDKAHKIFLRAITRWRKRGELPLKLSKDTLSEWESLRLRNLEEERRKKEQEVNAARAKEREAELEHLRKIGKTQEAEQLSLVPVRPVTVVVDTDAGKAEGATMVKKWVPKLDEEGHFIFSDRKAYRHWIADHPEFDYLVEDQYGKVKKVLTDNRGMLQPPGLVIEQKFEPRTRMESDE